MRLIAAWLLALCAFAGLALSTAPARAAIPPRPDGPVLDQAGVIPEAEEAALDQRLRSYNKATGRAVIVATVASLDGLEDEQYAQEMAESWDIGGAESEEGVLFLVAPNERKLRIHTGRGVQDRLTDAWSGWIIRDTVVPRFKAGDFGGGIVAGVDAIIAQLDRSPADAKAIAEAAEAARKTAPQGRDEAGFGSVIFWLFLFGFLWLTFARRGRRGRRSGIDPGIVLWGASEALHHLGGRSGGGWSSGGSDFGGGGGFGGFGGGGGGFDGGGASGDW